MYLPGCVLSVSFINLYTQQASMPREADTHVRVTEETWKRLNARKGPGDSFEDVIRTMLDELEADSEGNPNSAAATN